MLGIECQGQMPLKMFCKKCYVCIMCVNVTRNIHQTLIIILHVLFYSLHIFLRFLNYL